MLELCASRLPDPRQLLLLGRLATAADPLWAHWVRLLYNPHRRDFAGVVEFDNESVAVVRFRWEDGGVSAAERLYESAHPNALQSASARLDRGKYGRDLIELYNGTD